MLDKNNEVFFGEYCKTCKYKNYSETDCPCSECIAEPVNLYSHKPIRWEGADGIFSGPPPRPDHAYQRAVKYVPERRKDKEKAIARLNIDAEYTGNKVQSIDSDVTDDQYPSATAVKKALENKIDAPSGCECDELIAVAEMDEYGTVSKVKAIPAPKKLSDFENDLYYRKELPELTISLTKKDFVNNGSTDDGVTHLTYAQSSIIDPDFFKSASIKLALVDLTSGDEEIFPDDLLTYEDHQDEGFGQAFLYRTSGGPIIAYVSNGYSIKDGDVYDGVEIGVYMLESVLQSADLVYVVKFYNTAKIPEYAVDFTKLNAFQKEMQEMRNDISDIWGEFDNSYRIPVVRTTGTVNKYKVTTPNNIGNNNGDLLIVIPHVTSSSNAMTLTINNGKPQQINLYRMGFNPGNSLPTSPSWFQARKAFLLINCGGGIYAIGASTLTDTGTINCGYCDTKENVQNKVAYLDHKFIDTYVGSLFAIVFLNNNTAENPKLRVYSANSNYRDIVTSDGTPIRPGMIKAGKLCLFMAAYSYGYGINTDLKNKYILLNPDEVDEVPSLPTPTTAQVGQIVKVKAVDADGKITETETVDVPDLIGVSELESGMLPDDGAYDTNVYYDTTPKFNLHVPGLAALRQIVKNIPSLKRAKTLDDFNTQLATGNTSNLVLYENYSSFDDIGWAYPVLGWAYHRVRDYYAVAIDGNGNIWTRVITGMDERPWSRYYPNSLTLRSSSYSKTFNITVDDSGTISATEITN